MGSYSDVRASLVRSKKKLKLGRSLFARKNARLVLGLIPVALVLFVWNGLLIPNGMSSRMKPAVYDDQEALSLLPVPSTSTTMTTDQATTTIITRTTNSNNNNYEERTTTTTRGGGGGGGSLLSSSSGNSYDIPCNRSGTHYFFNGRYHYHTNSSDLIRAVKEGVYYRNELEDNTNSEERMNMNMNMGVFYSVSGTEQFATSAFLPVVEYLRNGLGIPDAFDRQQQQQPSTTEATKSSSSYSTPWALATDPYLCNTAALRSVLPFFDVLIIITPDDLRNENKDTKHWTPDDDNSSTTSTGRGKHAGTGSQEERKNNSLKHYVKAVKVKALCSAPFPISVFIDVDMIPCVQDFASVLVEHAIASASSVSRSFTSGTTTITEKKKSFDMAITNIAEKNGRSRYNMNETGHYFEKARQYDQHNTCCVILNMTSTNTIELLRRFKEHFFSLTAQKPKFDQPSFGKSMFDMWQLGRRGQGPRFNHVDMKGTDVCRNKIAVNKGQHGCNVNNECLVSHKMKTLPSSPTSALVT